MGKRQRRERMVAEDGNGDSSSPVGNVNYNNGSEHSFDELTKALVDGSLSRGQALRLMAGALIGSVMASIPGVAWAQQGDGGCPLTCPEGFRCRLARSSPDSPRTAFCCVEGRDGRYYPGTPYCCQPEEIVGGQCCHPPVFEPCGDECCSAGQCLNGTCCSFGVVCSDTCCPLDWTCVRACYELG